MIIGAGVEVIRPRRANSLVVTPPAGTNRRQFIHIVIDTSHGACGGSPVDP